MSRIVVTGLGIISALGMGADDTYARLLEGRSGIGKMKYLKSKHTDLPVGEVPFSDEELRETLFIRKDASITRTSLLGAAALREALASASLLPRDKSWKMALISGTTVGGMEKSEQYYYDFLNTRERDEYIALHDCGACTDMIGQANPYGFEMMTTISTACSSAANAIILGANMLKLNRTDIVVVGGTECLSKFHLDGFNSLMILDHEPCRPFDKNRNGLNLGEGAAYLVMEREEIARQRGVTPLCQLSGYGNRCDAFHQTASSPDGEGAYQSMMEYIDVTGVTSSVNRSIPLKILDNDGNVLSNSIFKRSIPAVNVQMKVLPHKHVNINYELLDREQIPDIYEIQGETLSVSSIDIAAEPEVLAALETIEAAPISVASINETGDYEYTLSLGGIPEKAVILDDVDINSIQLTVTVSDRYISANYTNVPISFVNENPEYSYEYSFNSVDITVYGPAKLVGGFVTSDIMVIVNLAGRGMGDYDIDIESKPMNVETFGDMTITFSEPVVHVKIGYRMTTE